MKEQYSYLKELLESDPKSAYTMRAINGVGLSIEGLIEPAHQNVLMRKGIIAGMTASIPLVDQIKAEVQKEVDEEKLEGETAKVILQWLSRVQTHLEKSRDMNQRELAVQEGIIEGLKKAVQKCENLYTQEEMKIKQRENDAFRGTRDEGGRPRPIRELRELQEKMEKEKMEKEKAEETPKPKKRRRVTKKRAGKNAGNT